MNEWEAIIDDPRATEWELIEKMFPDETTKEEKSKADEL